MKERKGINLNIYKQLDKKKKKVRCYWVWKARLPRPVHFVRARVLLNIFIASGANNKSSFSCFIEKLNKKTWSLLRRTMYCLILPIFWPRIRVEGFLTWKPNFQSKKSRKHHRIIDKPVYDLKKPKKKISKHKINSKQKVFLSSYMVFRHLHGKKKHINWTLIIKWNYLTQKSIVLEAKIDADDIFLSTTAI